MATAEQLLNDSMLAMADLHDSMDPDENEECATIGPEAVRIMVWHLNQKLL